MSLGSFFYLYCSFEQAKLEATTSEFEAQHNQLLTCDELTTEVRNWVKRKKQATGTRMETMCMSHLFSVFAL